MRRLIDQEPAQAMLLNAIAAVPAGVKLNIPALRDQLIDQREVIRGIECLIASGRIDPATLRPGAARPPVKAAPSLDRPTGRELFDRVMIEVRRRGLSQVAASIEIFGSRSGLPMLAKGVSAVRPATLERATSWLDRVRSQSAKSPDSVPPAAPADDSSDAAGDCGGEAKPKAKAASSPPPLSGPSGDQFADEILAFLKRSGGSKARFGRMVFNTSSGVDKLRKVKQPTAALVARVRAFMDEPPAEFLQPRSNVPAKAQPVVSPAAVAPIAARPSDVSVNQRRSAAVRREHSQAGARLVEREAAGEVVANVSPAIRAAANLVRDRQAAQAREIDPVERAKLSLQRKGYTVFAASVSGGPAGHFYIGKQLVTEQELLHRAGLTAPAPSSLKPAEMAFCDQCDRRVSGAQATKCASPFCKLKRK